MINPGEECRIIIHARVTDIPGELNRRYLKLAELFSAEVLCTPFQQAITLNGYD
jgi:hypothetical protein